MSLFKAALPFTGQILLLAVLATVLFGQLIKQDRLRLGVVAAFVVLGMTVSVYGLSLAQWLRSVVGDLSVCNMLIILNILTVRLARFALFREQSRLYLLIGVALLGVAFYPFALGVSGFDPYRLGYAPLLLSFTLCALSIISWLGGHRALATIILLPLLAFNLQLLESSNLWDYLLDPILVIYALVQLLLTWKRSAFNKAAKFSSSSNSA